MNRRTTSIVLALSLLAPFLASAQEPWPAKPVKIVVPYGAGGSTDVITRIVAQKLSDRLGQPVVVENRAGANGIIGAEAVAKASPDGYTLFAASNGHAVNAGLYKTLPFDTVKDFVPVVGIASMPNVLAVHPGQPFRTVKEIVDAAKTRPDGLSYGHAGIGSSQHLSGEMMRLQASGAKLRGIAYKGGGPAVTDALGGHVPLVFAGLPAIVKYVQAGQMRPIAVTSLKRSAQLPDVPTLAEQGFPGFNEEFWIAILAPRGTPQAVVAKLNTEVNAILALPDVQAQLAKQGADATGGSPEKLGKFIQEAIDTAAKVIRDANIKAEG